MKHQVWIGLGVILLALLVGTGSWGYGLLRQVDGRSPAQWLAYAAQASQQVAYHAEGHSITNGKTTHFNLTQGTDGRYLMTTRDSQGRSCSLGYDGNQLWYSSGNKQEKLAVAQYAGAPMPKQARILGTATIAGRPVVQLAVSNGSQRKILAIDRKTGVVLAVTTRGQRHIESEMRIDRVEYRPVVVPACAMPCATLAKTVDRVTLAKKLGGRVLEPHWMPKGYALTEMLLEPCNECGQPMGVLRYSDGISALTLFEMSQHEKMCGMGEGCCQTREEHTLVASKTIGNYAVTAVGSVDVNTLRKVLDHLR